MAKLSFETLPAPPAAKTLGWKFIGADQGAGSIELEFQGKPEFANPSGFVQGGFITAMLDDTLGPAILVATDFRQIGRTIDLHTHFLRPAPIGPLIGKGWVTRLGKSVAFMEGHLSTPDGKTVARATASAMLFEFQP